MKFAIMTLFSLGIFLSFVVVSVLSSSPRYYPSMGLTNWENMVLTWTNAQLNPNTEATPLGVTSLRRSDDYSYSLLTLDSFLISIDSTIYSNVSGFTGDAYLTEDGVFHHNISVYNSEPFPYNFSRSITFPPYQEFYIVTHTLSNPTNQPLTLSVMEYFITNGTGSWDGIGLVNDGNMALGIGSWGNTISEHQFGPLNGEYSPVTQFQQTGKLTGTSPFSSYPLCLGILSKITIPPFSEGSVSSWRTVQLSENIVNEVAEIIQANTVQYWYGLTALLYSNYLSQGIPYTNSNPNLQSFFRNSILLLKNSFMPGVGTAVASFHPVYGYRVWARDGCFSSMIMDTIGHFAEAEEFLVWISTAELRDNNQGFHTCYDWFTGDVVSFVEPQYDNDGAFLMACYHHFLLTKDVTFLEKVYPRILTIEQFLVESVSEYNFAPPDYSIWEESSDPYTGQPLPPSYFTFTQSMVYSGLISAAFIEQYLGNNSWADTLNNRAAQIKTAVLTHLWVQDGSYFARGIWSDTLDVDLRKDTSSVASVFTGLVSNMTQAQKHIQAIQANLTELEYGMARYWGDIFFYESKFNPGGQEVSAPNPPWGVCTMFMSWAELAINANKTIPSERLLWMMERGAPGFMGVGEAIDGVTGDFVMSSTPDLYEHSGVFLWTALLLEGKALPPNPSLW